jgi:hypothetical protein
MNREDLLQGAVSFARCCCRRVGTAIKAAAPLTFPPRARCSCSVPLCCAGRCYSPWGGRKYRMEHAFCSDHHRMDPAVFEAFPCQTLPRHSLDTVPVLAEITRSLMLGRKFGLQAASLAQISVGNLKKHRLLPFLRRCPRPLGHRFFLSERWHGHTVGMAYPAPALRRYWVVCER